MMAQGAALRGAASCNCADVSQWRFGAQIGDSALSPMAASRKRTPHTREKAIILDIEDPRLRDSVYGKRRMGRVRAKWNGALLRARWAWAGAPPEGNGAPDAPSTAQQRNESDMRASGSPTPSPIVVSIPDSPTLLFSVHHSASTLPFGSTSTSCLLFC